jgi:hypothetical protein
MEHEEGSISHSTAKSGIFLPRRSKFWDYPYLSKLHFIYGSTATSGPEHCHFSHSFRHITLGTSPLDERSARRRIICMTTHNTNKRQISVSPAGFETAIPASERPQAHVLDRAATGIGLKVT